MFRIRKDRPQVKTGYLLIIDADPWLVLKMDQGSRILYLGKQPGWRVNPAYPSSRAFVLVPAGLNKAGEVDLDLTRIRIWLGTDRFEGDAALAEADGQPRAFKDLIELHRHYARLMKEYLPPDEASPGDALLMLKRLGVN